MKKGIDTELVKNNAWQGEKVNGQRIVLYSQRKLNWVFNRKPELPVLSIIFHEDLTNMCLFWSIQ